MKVYRVTVSAYNSQQPAFPPALFTYDIRAFSPTDAADRIPHTLTAPGPRKYRVGMRLTQAYYSEWAVQSVRLRRGIRGVSQTVRPLVWLHRTSVLLVGYEAGQSAQTIRTASGMDLT